MLYEADNFYTAQLEYGKFYLITFTLHCALDTAVLQILTYGNLLEITKPFFKGHACSQVLFVHCCSQQIYLLTLIFQTHFSSSYMCQSKVKCRTLQQQDIKRRQGTECTSREYFHISQITAIRIFKSTNYLGLFRELLKAASYLFITIVIIIIIFTTLPTQV